MKISATFSEMQWDAKCKNVNGYSLHLVFLPAGLAIPREIKLLP